MRPVERRELRLGRNLKCIHQNMLSLFRHSAGGLGVGGASESWVEPPCFVPSFGATQRHLPTMESEKEWGPKSHPAVETKCAGINP